ncbi:MAG: transcription antitermination factor NusB [Candidatus Pacebacteria bacterium]|nr:transcription antitermination factor NusB [Candidatus Paceibacterota bacterium]
MTDSQAPDQRHLHRAKLVQSLFAYTFDHGQEESESPPEKFVEDQRLIPHLKQIVAQLPQIDPLLQKYAPERPLSEINQVDLAILRIVLFEFLNKKTPRKVLIDEAVELAKEFGSESSPRFVNGVLGKLLIEQDLGRQFEDQPDQNEV